MGKEFGWKGDSIDKLSKGRILRNVGSYTVLGLALGAMTFFGVCDPQGNVRAPSGSAAVVGDEVVSASEFKRFYSQTLDRFRSSQPDYNPAKDQLSRQVMDYMVNERAVFAKAKQLGLEASKAEVEELILKSADNFKDQDGKFSASYFRNYLKRNGYTEASFIEEQRRALTTQKLEQFLQETFYVPNAAALVDYQLSESKLDVSYLKFTPDGIDVKVDEKKLNEFKDSEDGKKEIKQYYDRNKTVYNRPEEMKARHILIQFEGARNASGEAAKRKKEVAKKKAESVLAKVNRSGADFAKIAKAETDEESGKTKGGDLGWFKRETMVKEFSDAAFKLQKGKISGIVESPFGFHIIKVEGKKEPINRSLEEVTDEIARLLIVKDEKPKLVEKRANEVLSALKENKSANQLLRKYKVKWEESGEFSLNARAIPTLGTDKGVRSAVLSLKNPGDLHPMPVKRGNNFYILKLKKRLDADTSNLKEERIAQLRQTEVYIQSRGIVSELRSSARKQFDDEKSIWTNAEFAGWDMRSTTGSD